MAIDATQYFAANTDVAQAYAQNSFGMTPEQFAEYHWTNFGQTEGRPLAPVQAGQQWVQSDYNPNYTRPGQLPGHRRPTTDMVQVTDQDGNVTWIPNPSKQPKPDNPYQTERAQRAVDRQLSNDTYQTRGMLNNQQWRADKDMWKTFFNQAGDDANMWRAAKLGVQIAKDPATGKWVTPSEYLGAKYGTSDWKAYAQQLGVPMAPVTGQAWDRQGMRQGMQDLKDYNLKMQSYTGVGPNVVKKPGMFQGNPQSPGTSINPSANQFRPAVQPFPSVQPTAQAAQPTQVGQVTGNGMFPTVGDSSAWRAAPTNLTQQQRNGLFN